MCFILLPPCSVFQTFQSLSHKLNLSAIKKHDVAFQQSEFQPCETDTSWFRSRIHVFPAPGGYNLSSALLVKAISSLQLLFPPVCVRRLWRREVCVCVRGGWTGGGGGGGAHKKAQTSWRCREAAARRETQFNMGNWIINNGLTAFILVSSSQPHFGNFTFFFNCKDGSECTFLRTAPFFFVRKDV